MDGTMILIFESERALITCVAENGQGFRLLWTDKKSGAQARTLQTWKDCDSAKRALEQGQIAFPTRDWELM
jgi:hypothetical protein